MVLLSSENSQGLNISQAKSRGEKGVGEGQLGRSVLSHACSDPAVSARYVNVIETEVRAFSCP